MEGGKGTRRWGITHLEVCSQQKGGVVVRAPDTSMARDVQNVQGGVIRHEGACAMGRPDPVTQGGQEEVSQAAENLGEDRLPEGPIQG